LRDSTHDDENINWVALGLGIRFISITKAIFWVTAERISMLIMVLPGKFLLKISRGAILYVWNNEMKSDSIGTPLFFCSAFSSSCAPAKRGRLIYAQSQKEHTT
jgi:hypothetical protein